MLQTSAGVITGTKTEPAWNQGCPVGDKQAELQAVTESYAGVSRSRACLASLWTRLQDVWGHIHSCHASAGWEAAP